MIETVWKIVDKAPGMAWAVAKLNGTFFFVVHSKSNKQWLIENLPPGIHADIDVNYSDHELEHLKKHKIG